MHHQDRALLERADALADKLDALHLILNVQARRIKDLGFEFEITTEEVPESEPSLGTSKKPRLSDPTAMVVNEDSASDGQTDIDAFNTWAENALKEIEQCKKDCEATESRQKSTATLDRIGKELEARRNNTHESNEQFQNVERSLQETRSISNALNEKDELVERARPLREQLEEIETWRDKWRQVAPSANQLIHLRNRLRSLRQMRPALDELAAKAIILLTKPLPESDRNAVDAESKLVKQRYEQLLSSLSDREGEIKLALARNTDDPRARFDAFRNKIAALETKILTEHALLAEPNETEHQLERLILLRKEFDDLQSTHDAVVAERRNTDHRGSLEQLDFRSSVENLVTKFGDSRTILDQKIGKLQTGLSLLKQLKEDTQSVRKWLDSVEKFVSENDVIPVGDVEQLDKLLDASNKYDDEKKEYAEKLKAVDEAKATILEDCEDTLSKAVQADTKDLRKRFDEINEKAFKLNEGLRRALEKSEDIFRRMDEMEEWLGKIESQLPTEEECGISDSGELYKMKTRFQGMKDQCDNRTDDFRDLNETGHEILVSAERRPGALARRLTHLNARWTIVTHGVYERYKILAEAWHETSELRAWVSQENAWLDGLHRILRRSATPRTNPTDAEDMWAELGELESYVQNHDSARVARIQAVGRQLVAAHIMPASIRADLDNMAARTQLLTAQAESRRQVLEQCAREAAQYEVRVEELQSWLTTALEAGPHQQASAREQLPGQLHLLQELREQAPDGGRLREQLDLLQEKFTQLEKRLESAKDDEQPEDEELGEEEMQQFPISGSGTEDIAGRVTRATNALREVQRACNVALPSPSPSPAPAPDAVRAQLRECLKFYRTLSEMKAEVESVIKAGRRATDGGGDGSGGGAELSRRVDALKQLYNKLGAQVTAAKARLESALVAARELQSDLSSLEGWLQTLPPQPPRAKLELEMSRVSALRDRLHDNYDRLAAACDIKSLEQLRARRDAVDTRWHAIRAQLAADTSGGTKEADSEHNADYERVTDTIKRRLDSPLNSPDTERPELKKSKIPLALRSPAPIRKEVKEGGSRSRGSSLERVVRPAPSPLTPTSPGIPTSPGSEASTAPVSPEETKPKDSSTFNLLQDSDLFTQISEDKIEARDQPAETRLSPSDRTVDPCQVVAVKEVEIVRGTVNSPVNSEEFPSETVRTSSGPVAQKVETVELPDDSEDEPAVTTFVVEVREAERPMKPTRGVLTRREEIAIPDLIPGHERDFSSGTPPPTPMEEGEQCPPLLRLPETTEKPHENITPPSGSDEAIYSEVEDAQSMPLGAPLGSSTPARGAQVVGVARKQLSSPATPAPSMPEEKYNRTEDKDTVSRLLLYQHTTHATLNKENQLSNNERSIE
ncbi:hypothetical protein evm_011875 [Chilo suppressalis]|nr:hypothetical protein evm_011875 [Chilo suppressalis]